jgi:hypothetical protein
MKSIEFIHKWLPQFASTRFERPEIEADLKEVAKEMMPEMFIKFMEWTADNNYGFTNILRKWINMKSGKTATTEELVKLWEEQK